jgi:phage gp46-like protein
MLMALLMFAKWWKFITKKPSITSLLFILNSQKHLDKVYNDLEDQA